MRKVVVIITFFLINNSLNANDLSRKDSLKLSKIGVEHFKLPHPSGLNRKLNDKKYVNKVLKECYEYCNR